MVKFRVTLPVHQLFRRFDEKTLSRGRSIGMMPPHVNAPLGWETRRPVTPGASEKPPRTIPPPYQISTATRPATTRATEVLSATESRATFAPPSFHSVVMVATQGM